MTYYYRIVGKFPNNDTAYDFNVFSLIELRKKHKEILHSHHYYIYKYSEGKFKEKIYEKHWNKVYIDKKNLDKKRL